MEQWRDIPGYEGIYQVSNLGNVRTCDGKTTYTERHGVRHWKQRNLKQKFHKNRYGRTDARIILWKDGLNRTWLVARLVGLAWCTGFSENMTINHINGNSLDNRAENLEWVSIAENIQKGFATGLYSTNQRSIHLADEAHEVIMFPSMADASRFLNRNNSYVSNCIKNCRAITNSEGKRYFIRELSL